MSKQNKVSTLTADTAGLVAELRAVQCPPRERPIINKAADTITALTAENAALKALVDRAGEALESWLKSFCVYTVEDDDNSIRLSMGGQQIACWGASSPQGAAMLQFDAGHRSTLTAIKEARHAGN